MKFPPVGDLSQIWKDELKVFKLWKSFFVSGEKIFSKKKNLMEFMNFTLNSALSLFLSI